jgi:hypothetical protein
MTYVNRIDETITVTYAGNTVSIRVTEPYWNHTPDQIADIPISKLNMLIMALQDIAEIKRKEW